ncbi:MAG: RCC1 domain-containing protein [Polyangiales bacterium]
MGTVSGRAVWSLVALMASCHGRCGREGSTGPEQVEEPAVARYGWAEPPALEGEALEDVVELGSSEQEFCARRADGAVVCWGNRQNANAPKTPFTARVALGGAATALHFGYGGSCATLEDRSLWCWAGTGLWFTGEPVVRTPQQVPGVDVTGPVGVSTLGYCAVTGSPTRIRCDGALMDGYLHRDAGVTAQEETPLEQVQGIRAVEAALANYFCVRTEEAVRCFTQDEVAIPEPVRSWQQISGSGAYLCGVDADGRVAAWYPNEERITRVEGVRDAVAVDCMDHGCILHADRTVSCFAFARAFRPTRYPAPLEPFRATRIEGVTGALQVAAGEGAACALLEDHTVVCWGRNNGSLGIGAPLVFSDDMPSYPPRRVRAPR